MGEERIVTSELMEQEKQEASRLKGTTEGGPHDLDPDQEGDSEEELSPEAMFQMLVVRKGLAGTAAKECVSQLLEAFDMEEREEAGSVTHAGTGSGSATHAHRRREGGEAWVSTRGRETLPKIDVSDETTFSALLKGGDIIPRALTEALSNDQFLPLSFFLSSELSRRNMTNTQYQFKSSAAHERPVIDVGVYEDRDLFLSRDQFIDGHRNLLRAYRVCYGERAVEDLHDYQERLYSDGRFHDDEEFPAFQQFDKAVRVAWHNRDGGHYRLSADDTFAQLDRFINKLYSTRNTALARSVLGWQRGTEQSGQSLRHSRSSSPHRRSASPPPFGKGSGSNARQARCILCGSNKHNGYLCPDSGGKCVLRGTGVTLKTSGERICFDYNVPKGCNREDKHYGVHRCSICNEVGHGAQKCLRTTL
jgi:hypothetical protein